MAYHSSPGASTQIKYDEIVAKVVRVHVDGLGRTNESLVMKNLKSMFSVKHFEDLVVKSEEVRSRLAGNQSIPSPGVTLHIGFVGLSEEDLLDRQENGKCIRNSVKIQSKFSRNSAQILSKCSQNPVKIIQNVVKIQSKFSQNLAKIQSKFVKIQSKFSQFLRVLKD